MNEEILENIEEVGVERQYPFCVISVKTFGDYAKHDIQTNSTWSSNPYDDYVVVPDDIVGDIMATKGYCDIILNDEGTGVISFTAREIPEIPEGPEEEPTADELMDILLGVSEDE